MESSDDVCPYHLSESSSMPSSSPGAAAAEGDEGQGTQGCRKDLLHPRTVGRFGKARTRGA